MDRFVLDASMTAAWCFSNEATPATTALLRSLRQRSAIVPALWHAETGNLLLQGEKRGRITEASCTAFVETLAELPIETDHEGIRRGHGAVLSLARHHGLTVYDATYLELAVRLNLPLATRDQELIAVSRVIGVTLIEA